MVIKEVKMAVGVISKLFNSFSNGELITAFGSLENEYEC